MVMVFNSEGHVSANDADGVLIAAIKDKINSVASNFLYISVPPSEASELLLIIIPNYKVYEAMNKEVNFSCSLIKTNIEGYKIVNNLIV